MTITVNSRETEWVKNESVAQLLKRMNYTFPMVVVKIDGRVVPKARYPDEMIPNHSGVEIIHLISGG